jgi:hypothetical protein
MTDTPQFNASEDMEAYQEMIKKIQEQIDPRDYLAPSMREIAYLTLEELEAERNLVVAKQSTRSRAQRDMIESRWEYEQIILNSKEDGVD